MLQSRAAVAAEPPPSHVVVEDGASTDQSGDGSNGSGLGTVVVPPVVSSEDGISPWTKVKSRSSEFSVSQTFETHATCTPESTLRILSLVDLIPVMLLEWLIVPCCFCTSRASHRPDLKSRA